MVNTVKVNVLIWLKICIKPGMPIIKGIQIKTFTSW